VIDLREIKKTENTQANRRYRSQLITTEPIRGNGFYDEQLSERNGRGHAENVWSLIRQLNNRQSTMNRKGVRVN